MGLAQWFRIGNLVGLLGEPPTYSNPAKASLVQIGEPAVKAISRVAATSRSPHARTKAVQALAEIGGPAARAALIRALHDPVRDVARTALRALEEVKDSQVSDALAGALENSAVAESAAWELAQRGDARGLNVLIASDAVGMLEHFLKHHAGKATNDQLRKCMKVEKIERWDEDIPGAAATNPEGYRMGTSDTYRVFERRADTSRLKQLAQQELVRRGSEK